MATVTGLTAERMLAIEAGSVVDGDVVGDNLILTKHDGSQVNAGNVRGPVGPAGPVGADLAVLAAIPVLDVGVLNQIRAGRQLTAVDFTNMGLSAPLGLWNLSDLTDASGNGRALINKGGVVFGTGINGGNNTAAQFTGDPAKALYIADVGAADPFRIRTGSIGCWVKTGKKTGASQAMITKSMTGGGWDGTGFDLSLGSTLAFVVNPNGSGAGVVCSGITDLSDDRWHFIVGTIDGVLLRLYVDGILEQIAISGPIAPTNYVGPLNIGSYGASAGSNASNPSFGRVDEAFVTADVLSEDQIRNLYCVKIPHALGAIPSRFALKVRRRRRGAALAVGDFPVQPLRLHNFSGGSLADAGSNGTPLANNNGATSVSGADGLAGNAFGFSPAQTQYLSATDALLPAAFASRSYGCWMKAAGPHPSGNMVLMTWGAAGNRELLFTNSGNSGLYHLSGADQIGPGPFMLDGQWHFVVVTEDNAPLDGVKRKIYVDGRLVIASTVLGSITLGGANMFRVGSDIDNTARFVGQLDAVFVCGQTLTVEQIQVLYAKGSQTLSSSPKNAGDHIESADAANVFAIFDTIDLQNQIDLTVAA